MKHLTTCSNHRTMNGNLGACATLLNINAQHPSYPGHTPNSHVLIYSRSLSLPIYLNISTGSLSLLFSSQKRFHFPTPHSVGHPLKLLMCNSDAHRIRISSIPHSVLSPHIVLKWRTQRVLRFRIRIGEYYLDYLAATDLSGVCVWILSVCEERFSHRVSQSESVVLTGRPPNWLRARLVREGHSAPRGIFGRVEEAKLAAVCSVLLHIRVWYVH